MNREDVRVVTFSEERLSHLIEVYKNENVVKTFHIQLEKRVKKG